MTWKEFIELHRIRTELFGSDRIKVFSPSEEHSKKMQRYNILVKKRMLQLKNKTGFQA
jgi:hypothetical protein